MLLKGDKIVEYLKDGQDSDAQDPFVISPSPSLDELQNSGSASVDLRLGTWFVSLRQARLSHLEIGKKQQSQLTKTRHIRYGETFYLHPQSFVLGITLEWIRLPSNLAAYVIGKSSLGRRGLIIATATGVHPGFTGCLTLELTNTGEIPVAIKPGMKICQLFIHQVQDETSVIECSQFVGMRKPELGEVKLDIIAEALGDYHIDKNNTQPENA